VIQLTPEDGVYELLKDISVSSVIGLIFICGVLYQKIREIETRLNSHDNTIQNELQKTKEHLAEIQVTLKHHSEHLTELRQRTRN